MNRHWPAKYKSLFVYLTDWADFRPSEARQMVERAIREAAERRAAT